MIFSQERYQDAISRNEPIDCGERAYYRQRFMHIVFENLITKFAQRAENYRLTKAKIARLLEKDPSQINRALSLPSNMTLEMLSDLSLAMGCEPDMFLSEFECSVKHNDVHPAMRGYVGSDGNRSTTSNSSKIIKTYKDSLQNSGNKNSIGIIHDKDTNLEAA